MGWPHLFLTSVCTASVYPRIDLPHQFRSWLKWKGVIFASRRKFILASNFTSFALILELLSTHGITCCLSLAWTTEIEPDIMRAILTARIGLEKHHETETPQLRAADPQAV